MPTTSQPFRTNILIGLGVGLFLIVLAIMLLSQLLLFPQQGTESFSSIFNQRIVSTLQFTIFQAALSAFLSIMIGLVLAWSLARNPHFPFRRLLISIISTSLVLPTLVVVLGLVTVYGRNGWIAHSMELFGGTLPFSIYGLAGILMAHVLFNASFAARVFLHRFEAIPAEKYKLALSLDIGFIQRLQIIEWPAVRGSIAGIATTIFLLCFTSFAIVLTLGGSPSYNTLEVAIYEAVRFEFDLVKAFNLAMIQLIICLLLVLLSGSRSNLQFASISIGRNQLQHHLIRPVERWLQRIIIILFALFFILPLIAIFMDGSGAGFLKQFMDRHFINAMRNSFAIATTSTILALFVSLAIAQASTSLSLPLRRSYSGLFGKLAEQNWLRIILLVLLNLSSMIYLVFPALVMGLGFFLLYRNWGGDPDIWAGIVVTLSNTCIAIPFTIAMIRPAMVSSAKKHDRLCLSLNIAGWKRWRLIEWPALRSDITYAAALAFCFSMGDLGVIALFGSDEFRTLPWLLFQKFGSYRTDEAASIALFLLLVISLLFWLAQMPRRSNERVS